ncbi:MAG: hypothetical protein LBR26_05650 [Prevotella sp.]|jgi:hypothetical protein|nr:hypothetical protein [Prevotella sp.]
MERIYNIGSARESKIGEYRSFDVPDLGVEAECSSAYNEILNILREAFSLVDITRIIKKL